MKIETIPTIVLEKEEKEQLTIYLNAIQTLFKKSFCGAVDCCSMTCSTCPFTKLTDLDDALGMAINQFLDEYRIVQNKYPHLPPIN